MNDVQSIRWDAIASMCVHDPLGQPREILLKEIERSRILVRARDGMNANCAAAQGIVAAGATTNGDPANCARRRLVHR